MLFENYLDHVVDAISRFRESQGPSLKRAAECVARSVKAGGALHHFDTGHMRDEPVRRAGGFFGLHHLEARLEVHHSSPPGRARKPTLKQNYIWHLDALAAHVFSVSNMAAGDVLVLVSNSGKEPFPIELALQARRSSVAVVAITSVAFSETLLPAHPCGKRLFEIADVVIDNQSHVGDAVVEVAGVETKICPTSGVLSAVALWSLTAEIVAACLAVGVKPTIYRSVNLPDGFEFNERAEQEYVRKGF
ncbi:MAG: sugar isomerase domain-containing protein [Planctomycetes bacterium]|nr:sugar isomerase domain-containing protein [Planctomycetota bacterium]MBI3846882.1 sugar isomerase domain-containing protein [Planctomycetota bacterium]